MALITRSDLQNIKIEKSFDSWGFEKKASNILKENASGTYRSKNYDIFLSHSYWDAEEILKLKSLIERFGYRVFVDWYEDELKDRTKVSKQTANLLKSVMDNCKSLFYAFTENSKHSLWIPWELGYMDAKKDRVAILPILEIDKVTEKFTGTEYVGLYPYVTITKSEIGRKKVWINDGDKYVDFNAWLNGEKPYKHNT